MFLKARGQRKNPPPLCLGLQLEAKIPRRHNPLLFAVSVQYIFDKSLF